MGLLAVNGTFWAPQNSKHNKTSSETCSDLIPNEVAQYKGGEGSATLHIGELKPGQVHLRKTIQKTYTNE